MWTSIYRFVMFAKSLYHAQNIKCYPVFGSHFASPSQDFWDLTFGNISQQLVLNYWPTEQVCCNSSGRPNQTHLWSYTKQARYTSWSVIESWEFANNEFIFRKTHSMEDRGDDRNQEDKLQSMNREEKLLR